MSNRSLYQNPLNERYSSKEMSYIFSDENKFKTWRSLWIALASAQKELGLDISEEQISQMKQFESDINYEEAKKIERETRHDVMSHVKAFGMQADKAKGIMHLGATSCYVGDNTDLINYKKALELIELKLASVLQNLAGFAEKYKDVPALGFTHFQAAQLTTVGKRATLWMYDLLMDLNEVIYRKENLLFRGVKGTTGTQASFMELFENDEDKVKLLDNRVGELMGFEKSYPVTGQTYSRKVDSQILTSLSGIAQSFHKITNDIRLLQSMKELEEPFEKSQIGSSAMAYKRNPMRSERIASLSKYVINISQNPAMVHATQWLERTLDDSANRRLSIAEAFLATDAILEIAINVTNGLVVYPLMIQKHIDEELPFMATEAILMAASKKGSDRQHLHEKIRVYSMQAADNVKNKGLSNNLIELLLNDEEFGLDKDELTELLKAENFTGRAKSQVEEFLENDIKPALERYSNLIANIELNV